MNDRVSDALPIAINIQQERENKVKREVARAVTLRQLNTNVHDCEITLKAGFNELPRFECLS
jgi:phosphoribosylformylglycinamidine (FGAM) synthase PurS component